MNWPAALYAAGVWLLAASVWVTVRRRRRVSNTRFALQVGQELVGALVLALVVGMLA